MLGEATVTFTGNIAGAPELRFTPAGLAVCNFTVAVQGRKRDATTNAYVDGDASFYRCTVWRELAEHVAESLASGHRVIVTGDLSLRTFVRADESKGLSVEVEVHEVGPSLRFATATVVKATRTSGPAPVPVGG